MKFLALLADSRTTLTTGHLALRYVESRGTDELSVDLSDCHVQENIDKLLQK